MTVTINLKPDVEARVSQRAAKEGAAVSDYLERIIEETVQLEKSNAEEKQEKNQAALAMLQQWDEADKTDDPEEISRRQADLDDFMAAMNASHTSDRVIYP